MSASSLQSEYRVLARKYRPTKLSELVGQNVLVRTLTNAIESGRIPHAFILTGIRGVGKTSTARIIARSLVCIGEDGKNTKPTINPCGVCEQCTAITEDRHVDIMEIDAASHTGVDDVRQITDNINYLPVMGRYRIYIIDEVHMLSKNAFNALLKTLEEPPAHTKFVFATTEIRKIPITILSRCMRFDLARIEADLLAEHLANIADKEGISITKDALALIAHASEGSVRDSLSLLDQAIGTVSRDTEITRANIQEMLGIADRSKVFDIFDNIVAGKPTEALKELQKAYNAGADPVTILQDLLELSHFLTQLKIIPDLATAQHIAEMDRIRGKELAGKLSLPFLARVWQMLLKGLSEAQIAPNALIAAEMVIIRLCYVSDLPTPSDLIKGLKSGRNDSADIQTDKARNPAPSFALEPVSSLSDSGGINLRDFSELADLFRIKDEYFIHSWLQEVYPVNFNSKNRFIEFRPAKTTPPDLAGKISDLLYRWTGNRWIIAISNETGSKSIHDKKVEEEHKARKEAENHPMVKAILDAFPGSAITKVEKVDNQLNSENSSKTDYISKISEVLK